MKPHKWAKEIKAWSDGAEIEVWDIRVNDWVIADQPSWNTDPNVNIEYRIKPQPKEPQYLYVYKVNGKIHLIECGGYIAHNKDDYYEYIGKIKLEQDDE